MAFWNDRTIERASHQYREQVHRLYNFSLVVTNKMLINKIEDKDKRTGKTLKQVSNPDEIVSCKVTSCEHFHRSLTDAPVSETDNRKLVDIAPRIAITAEYQGKIKEGSDCHKITRAIFPGGITHKVQYSSGVQAVAVYRRNYQMKLLERTIRCAEQLSGFKETL